MKYKEVTSISRDEAREAVASGDVDRVCDALVRLAFHDEDWEWVESVCLSATTSDDARIRRIGVTCLGHIARIHRRLHLEKVSPVLRALLRDNEVSGQVEDALDDIETFLNVDLARQWRANIP